MHIFLIIRDKIGVGRHLLTICCCLSHIGLCIPMDYSPPGASVDGVSQARILEWVAVAFSRGSSQPRDRTCVSCISRWIFLPLSHLKIYFLPSCKNHSKRIYSKILKMKKIKILTMDFFFFLSSLSLVHIVLFLKMSLILLCM